MSEWMNYALFLAALIAGYALRVITEHEGEG